jgi:hypothetical protein
MEERRAIWKARLLELGLFRVIRDMVLTRGGHAGREEIVAEIQRRLPREDTGRIFATVVGWGRFGGLFDDSEANETLSIE